MDFTLRIDAMQKKFMLKCGGFFLILLPFFACLQRKTQTVDLGVVTLHADPGWKSVSPRTIRMRSLIFSILAPGRVALSKPIWRAGTANSRKRTAVLRRKKPKPRTPWWRE